MRPRLTFADVSPEQAVVSFRLHEGTGAWLPVDASTLELMAGTPLVYAGSLTVLCHRGSATPAVRELLSSAGHHLAACRTYADRLELAKLLQEFEQQQRPIVVSHIPGAGLVKPQAYVVPPALLVELNHKANLHHFVPAQYVLARYSIPLDDFLSENHQRIQLPTVLKAGTRLPTGAGFDVMICRDEGELAGARQAFAKLGTSAECVVVEQYRDFQRSWCAQVGVSATSLRYLGAAEQVCGADGRWLGNYAGSGYDPPAALEPLALSIARAGQARGYTGFCGFDIGIDPQGHYWVFDLNFRACGSLVQLLLQQQLCAGSARAVSRNVRFDSCRPMEQLHSLVRPYIRSGNFVPTAAFDGLALAGAASLLAGYLVAENAVEIEKLRTHLASSLVPQPHGVQA